MERRALGEPVDLPYTDRQHDGRRGTVRRSETTSDKTSMRRTSRSLISTQPKVVGLPSDDNAGRAIGHFYRAEV